MLFFITDIGILSYMEGMNTIMTALIAAAVVDAAAGHYGDFRTRLHIKIVVNHIRYAGFCDNHGNMYRFPFGVGADYHVNAGMTVFSLFNLDMLVSRQCDYDTVSFFNGISGFKGYCPPVISKTVPHYSDLIHYIDEADNICKYFPDGYRLKIRACLFNFFFELNAHFYTHTDMPVHLSDDKMDKLKLVLNYIEKNFARTISIEEIAQWCHFSQSHFMKFFKNCTGTSFITYLNDYRLIIAARILKTTTQPVIIVASDCGFDNISYFNRKFKEKYGVSQREFRK